jgi:hypothetical protein
MVVLPVPGNPLKMMSICRATFWHNLLAVLRAGEKIMIVGKRT